MSTSTYVVPVLSEESLTILRTRGHTSPQFQNRRVISNASYMSKDSFDSESTVEIPDELVSQATLEFLEFTSGAATKLWENIMSSRTILPDVDFLEAVKFHIEAGPRDPSSHDDDEAWFAFMENLGLTRAFQLRVMNPEFKNMRDSASLKEWILLMIEERYFFLKSLDSFVKTPANGIDRQVSRMDLHTGTLVNGCAVPEGGSSIGATPPTSNSSTAQLSAATTTPDTPREIEGATTLFKGGTIARLQSMRRPENALEFRALQSTPPGDFSARELGLYFTKQEQVAFKYAQWLGQVVDGRVIPVGILQVAVPKDLLESMAEVFGEDWRKFVWANRRTVEVVEVPLELEYLRDYQWLTGPLCTQSQPTINAMSNRSELITSNLSGGESAIQMFTSQWSMMKLMNERCVGQVWITAINGRDR